MIKAYYTRDYSADTGGKATDTDVVKFSLLLGSMLG